MELKYDVLQERAGRYVRSPQFAAVCDELENSVLFNVVGTFIVIPIALLLICTIVFARIGFKIMYGTVMSVVTLDVFRDQRKLLQQHPERFTPLIAAGIIVGPRGHGLVLGSLDPETQTDLDLLERKALELARLYTGDQVPRNDADEEVLSILRQDAFTPDRRRRVPETHAEGHELLMFDLKIDEAESFTSHSGSLFLACLVTTEKPFRDGEPRGSIVQIPWKVVAPAVLDW